MPPDRLATAAELIIEYEVYNLKHKFTLFCVKYLVIYKLGRVAMADQEAFQIILLWSQGLFQKRALSFEFSRREGQPIDKKPNMQQRNFPKLRGVPSCHLGVVVAVWTVAVGFYVVWVNSVQ